MMMCLQPSQIMLEDSESIICNLNTSHAVNFTENPLTVNSYYSRISLKTPLTINSNYSKIHSFCNEKISDQREQQIDFSQVILMLK